MRATRVPRWRNRVPVKAGERVARRSPAVFPGQLGWAVTKEVPDCHPAAKIAGWSAISPLMVVVVPFLKYGREGGPLKRAALFFSLAKI